MFEKSGRSTGRRACRSHIVWQSFNFEIFEEIDAQFTHKVNATSGTVSAQPIKLETIGGGGLFAEFLFA